MGLAKRKAVSMHIPVYHRMAAGDTFDFVLLSIVETLLQELHIRCGTKYRESRIESMQDLLHKIEESYKGYIPDNYKNRAEKFLKMLHVDIDSLVKDIKTIKDN